MAVFNGVDFVRIDDLFTDEEMTIRQAVRDWVEERFLPLVEQHFEAGTFPMELIPELAELGLLGATLPEEYGCAGPRQRRLRADLPGARARRLRPALASSRCRARS